MVNAVEKSRRRPESSYTLYVIRYDIRSCSRRLTCRYGICPRCRVSCASTRPGPAAVCVESRHSVASHAPTRSRQRAGSDAPPPHRSPGATGATFWCTCVVSLTTSLFHVHTSLGEAVTRCARIARAPHPSFMRSLHASKRASGNVKLILDVPGGWVTWVQVACPVLGSSAGSGVQYKYTGPGRRRSRGNRLVSTAHTGR